MWNFDKWGARPAIISDNGVTLSYSQLKTQSDAIAAAVGKRSLVFSLCENTAGSILGYAAFVNNKIVPLLLNADLERGLLNNLIQTYRPDFLWLPEENSATFANMEKIYSSFGYVLLKSEYNAAASDAPLFNGLALLLTTSGSTGSPKLVRQSYKNIESNAKSIADYLKLNQSERPITTLPMNYTYGLSIINSHFLAGGTILATQKTLMQREFWDFFRAQNATSFGGVPYTYEILNRLNFFKMDLPSLKTMTQAGGKLLPSLHEKFAAWAESKGKKFVVMYGQCEATARMGYLPPENAVEKKGSMGIAIPGGNFSLVDENGGSITAPHTTGELVYRGENVTLGYAECREDLARGDERNGVLFTGDMAEFDEDGFYYIVGRKKRFLKVYGNRVNTDEIERLVKSEFDIECACSGKDDEVRLYITEKSALDAFSVKNFISHKTGLNGAAFKIIFVPSIPKNDSGKTLYSELEKLYRGAQ